MSERAVAGYDGTPNIYAANQTAGSFSGLSDEALEDKIKEYGSVLGQEGVNPRAIAGARRVLAHLTFEQQCRSGDFDDAVAAGVIAAADGETVTTANGESMVITFLQEE